MKKKLWLALLLLTLTLNVGATGYQRVSVMLHDGSVSQIDLSDDMKTTFDDKNVVFSDGRFFMEFEKVLIEKFEFHKISGIRPAITSDAAPVIKSGILTLSGLSENSMVAVYATSGSCIMKKLFSGTCSIDFNDYPSGVYIISVNNVSYKISITK